MCYPIPAAASVHHQVATTDCNDTEIVKTIIEYFPAAYKDNYAQQKEHGSSLLSSLGQGGDGSDFADLVMSITSLKSLALSAARIFVSRELTNGGNDVLNQGFESLYASRERAFGEVSGYLGNVSVTYRSCVRKKCWRGKECLGLKKEQTKSETTPGKYNPDPAYQDFIPGCNLPDEKKALLNAVRDVLREVMNGIQ